jgi:plasmid stabilization system protein ParE
MRVRITDDAKRDLLDAHGFYEDQSKGLFIDCLASDIRSLRVYAGIHPSKGGYHYLLSKRFPYAVHYLIEDGIVVVMAVVDCRRDPAWIEKRLS